MIAVGRVTRVHGVRGEVAVQPLSDYPDRFAAGSELHLEDGSTVVISAARPHADRILVSFRDIADREAAEALRGAYLFVSEAELPPLPEGSFWPHQLEGCEVRAEDGRVLGTLTEVLQGPGNDVWAVDGEDGRRLVVAVRDAVIEVDVGARRVVVREESLA
ncbi:MAG: ribosome maturation factor RimM [Actinobacteria bacterium]|nr:ribosome maturation factor RimM [Actinomycetota bacterium]